METLKNKNIYVKTIHAVDPVVFTNSSIDINTNERLVIAYEHGKTRRIIIPFENIAQIEITDKEVLQ